MGSPPCSPFIRWRESHITEQQCWSQDRTNRDQKIIKTIEYRDRDKTKSVYIKEKSQQVSAGLDQKSRVRLVQDQDKTE